MVVYASENREAAAERQKDYRARQLAKIEQAQREVIRLREDLHKRESEAENLEAKLGRPPVCEEDIAKYRQRISELQAEKKSWSQITRILNREYGEDESRTKSGWRYFFDSRRLAK